MRLNIRKFQVGGEFASLAVNYIPTSASTTAGAYAPAVATGSESSSRSSSKSEKDELSIKDVLKVFDNVKGLPIDVSYVLKDFKLMFDDDTLFSFSGKPSYSSLVTYYLNNIGKFNALGHSKELYEEARKELIANNSLDEIAIDRNGRIVVSTGEGIDAVTMNEFKKGNYKALTNRELLDLRLKKLPFGDSIYNTMTGVGMDLVIKKVNDLVHSLGTSEKSITGYTSKLSNDIKSGLNAMLELQGVGTSAMTVDGLYKNKAITKDLAELAKLALQAVYNSLTPQERTLLSIHSQEGSPTETISSIILSRTSDTVEFEPTLQASLNVDGTKKETSKKEQEKEGKDNPLTQMLEMKGGDYLQVRLITKEGTTAMGTSAVHYSSIPKIKGDTSISNMLSISGISGIVKNYEGITFGDLKVPVENLKDIMYNEGGGYVAILPATTDEYGNQRVDLSIMDTYNKIINSIDAEKGSAAWEKELATKLHEEGLDLYLKDSNSLDWKRFGQFLIVSGTTTDKWKFDTNSKWVELVDPTEDLQNRMKKALGDKDNPYDIDFNDSWLGWITEGSYDDVYRGTVYIPIMTNRNAGVSAWGDQVDYDTGKSNELNYLNILGKVQDFKTTGSEVLQ